MTEKGCDNCYYTYFDERAYPCSLCIRGIERTDQWQPSKKTKAEQTEPQIECENCKHYGTHHPCELDFKACRYEPKDEPQTDCSWK